MNIRAIRKSQGMPVSQLIALTNIQKSTINRYECEKFNDKQIKIGDLLKICNALNCRIEEIIQDQELIDLYNNIK